MSKLKINDKYLNIIENLFLFLFMAYAMLSTNSLTYGTKIIGVFMWPSMLLGVAVIGYRALNFKDYYKTPGLPFLILMLASIAVSTVINYRYSFKSNLIFCIYWALYFLVLYTVSQNNIFETVKHNFETLSVFYIIYMTANILASFYLMAINFSQKRLIEATSYEYCLGFIDGRLWGTFTNPNNAAVSAGIAALMLLYFAFKSKKYICKIINSILILIQFIYVALSDSRTGMVFCGVSFGTFALMMLLYKAKDKKFLYKAAAVLIAVVVTGTALVIPRVLKNGYNALSVSISEYRSERPSTPEEGEQKENDPPVIDRGYDLSDDVSNRRFDVWKSGAEIFSSSVKTMIVGTGFSGVADYAKDYVPDTYIINNDYSEIRTLDNEAMNVLVSQGLIGFIAAAAFVIYIFVFIIRKFYLIDGEKILLFSIAAAVVLGSAAGAMFVGLFFYKFSTVGIVFWLALGDMVYILDNKKKAV